MHLQRRQGQREHRWGLGQEIAGLTSHGSLLRIQEPRDRADEKSVTATQSKAWWQDLRGQNNQPWGRRARLSSGGLSSRLKSNRRVRKYKAGLQMCGWRPPCWTWEGGRGGAAGHGGGALFV